MRVRAPTCPRPSARAPPRPLPAANHRRPVNWPSPGMFGGECHWTEPRHHPWHDLTSIEPPLPSPHSPCQPICIAGRASGFIRRQAPIYSAPMPRCDTALKTLSLTQFPLLTQTNPLRSGTRLCRPQTPGSFLPFDMSIYMLATQKGGLAASQSGFATPSQPSCQLSTLPCLSQTGTP